MKIDRNMDEILTTPLYYLLIHRGKTGSYFYSISFLSISPIKQELLTPADLFMLSAKDDVSHFEYWTKRELSNIVHRKRPPRRTEGLLEEEFSCPKIRTNWHWKQSCRKNTFPCPTWYYFEYLHKTRCKSTISFRSERLPRAIMITTVSVESYNSKKIAACTPLPASHCTFFRQNCLSEQ